MAQRDQRVGAPLAENAFGQGAELGFELRVAHRPLQAADGVLDMPGELAPVLQRDGDVGLVLADAFLGHRLHLVAERDHAGVADAGIAVLVFSGAAVDDGDRR